MSNFDPNTFLNTQISDALSTESILVPEGEYPAIIGTIDESCFRSFQKRDGEWAHVFECPWEIDDQKVQEVTHRKSNRVRQTIFLDVVTHPSDPTRVTGLDLSKGMNTALGRLREALGQNTPGRPWSFGMLSGNSAMVVVEHRPGGDDRMFANVTAVRRQ